jgi:hypothetical protein
MGDRAPATVTVYNVKGREDDVAGVLTDYGFASDYDGSHVTTLKEVVNGATFVVDEASLGVCTELGADLAALGVSYRATQDAKYEYDGEVRMYTPELGTNICTASQDGDILVAGSDVEKLVDVIRSYVSGEIEPDTATMHDLREAVDRGDLLTGRKWTLALAALAS